MTEENEEDCDACKLGAILGITKYVCEQQGKEKVLKCEELYQKVVLGDIKIKEFISEVKKLSPDPMDQETLNSVESVLKEYGLDE